jgi:nucleoside 2-deoxyribosyltransferase
MNEKIYLAGPDVFRNKPIKHFMKLKKLCNEYGFDGLSPFDNENFDGELFSKEHSKSIFKSNVDLINKCDIIIANLTPFRGACIDDGTAWEIAYGYSKNKLIYGYTGYYDKNLKEITELEYPLDPEYGMFPNIESFDKNCVIN